MKDELTKKTGLSKRGRKLRAQKAHKAWMEKYSRNKRVEWATMGGMKTTNKKK